MAKINYSFRTLLRERKIPLEPKYITIPVKFEYPIGLKNQLKERSGIIFDQMATRSLNLKDNDDKYFNVIVRKMLILESEIKPELCFVPACIRIDFSVKQNTEETKQMHEIFRVNEKDHLAGLVFGDSPAQWIEWINVSRQRTKWGLMTEDNPEAAKFLVKELKEIEHIHLFEINWLTKQRQISELMELNVKVITYDDSLYSHLKTTSQRLVYLESNLVIEEGKLDLTGYLKAVEGWLGDL